MNGPAMETADPAVRDYLDRLTEAGRPLPWSELSELRQMVTEHVDAAIERGEDADAALARLGSPEEIVAAALPAQVAPAEPRLRALEVVAVASLELGGFIMGIGWLLGVILLWMSDRWKWQEKLLATLVLPGGLGFALLALATVGAEFASSICTEADGVQTCTSLATEPWQRALPWLLLLGVAACVAVTAYLVRVARPGRSRA